MFSGKTDDRGLWAGIQAGVLFFLAALACIYLSRQPATIAAIWLPNAILTAALLRAPLRQWPASCSAPPWPTWRPTACMATACG